MTPKKYRGNKEKQRKNSFITHLASNHDILNLSSEDIQMQERFGQHKIENEAPRTDRLCVSAKTFHRLERTPAPYIN